jgi:hypothetical protein
MCWETAASDILKWFARAPTQRSWVSSSLISLNRVSSAKVLKICTGSIIILPVFAFNTL